MGDQPDPTMPSGDHSAGPERDGDSDLEEGILRAAGGTASLLSLISEHLAAQPTTPPAPESPPAPREPLLPPSHVLEGLNTPSSPSRPIMTVRATETQEPQSVAAGAGVNPFDHLLPRIQAQTTPPVTGETAPRPAPRIPLPADPADLSAQAAWPDAVRRLIESLHAENQALKAALKTQLDATRAAENLADNDVLTPTLNRRAFLRELSRAMADCKRYGEQASLIFIDLDDFKSINDIYGHAAGDAALLHVADILTHNIREADAVGRLGGDEFAILLRRADIHATEIKARVLEAELSMGTFAHDSYYLKIGGSFGVRAYAGQGSPEEWLAEADAAMFLNKKTGR